MAAEAVINQSKIFVRFSLMPQIAHPETASSTAIDAKRNTVQAAQNKPLEHCLIVAKSGAYAQPTMPLLALALGINHLKA